MLSFVQFCVCMSTWNAAILVAQQTPPNIIWMWFDDLGIGDVSFMGGDVPTPILDALVVDKAVKLNFHYTESICSASRSAFLTGRYAFKSGLNTVIGGAMIDWGFNTANVLFTEILGSTQGNLALNYNNMIAGKWHVGRDSASRLPSNRGFKAGLYTQTGSGYYDYLQRESVALMDLRLGPVTDQTVKDARDAILGNPSTLWVRDTYAISSANGNVYQPEQLDATEYLEDVLVDEAKAFIAAQDDSQNPFFVYYSLWTPHTPLAAPPLVRDNATVGYSACQEAYNLQTAASCFLDTRCLYCAQIHYASLGIQDIVDEVKANANIDWSNTVLIVASDNGPVSSQTVKGSAMPLKGKKPYVFEGGIRAPAFMFGGLIESFTTSRCEYNEMVHVSDWYHIFMDMIGVSSNRPNYNPDADHSSLSIWENIKCRCTSNGQQLPQCNNNNPPREELMTMRMCGDASADPQMYAAAIIKDGYKLIVNGRNGAGEKCPSANNNANAAFWYSAPGLTYQIPNSDYYSNAYLPAKTRMGANIFNRVFKSACLEDLFQNNQAAMDDVSYVPFQYDEYLLYNIANDKIEACALDLSVAANLAKKDELLALLIAAQSEYDSPDGGNPVPVYAAFQAMMQSQPNCTDADYVVDEVYLPPWADGGYTSVVDYTTLWSNFVDNYQNCY